MRLEMAKLEAPVMLVILDGFGMGDQSDTTNAVVQAKPLCFNQLWDTYPHTKLEASGLAVGLPEGQMGNSEVGHLNLGSGRIVYQDLTRITKDVESGEFYNRPVMKELYEVAKKQSLHLIGLVCTRLFKRLRSVYGRAKLWQDCYRDRSLLCNGPR